VSFFTTRHRLFAPGPHRVVVWSPPPGEGHDVPALLGTSALAFPQAALACAATPAAVALLRTPEGGAGAVPVRWDAIDAAPGPRWAGAEYGRWRRASRWYVEARAAAVAFEAELILLAAEDAPALLAWSAQRAIGDPPTLVFLAGGLGQVPSGLRGVLRRRLLGWPSPEGLRYVLPSAFASGMGVRGRRLSARVAALDLELGPEAAAPRLRAIAEDLGSAARPPA
jgi:hypothetical protein